MFCTLIFSNNKFNVVFLTLQFLFAVSAIGTALGLITLGVYMMLKTWGYEVESYNWIPIASFSFVLFIASWAVLTLPFLVIPEIMPEKLKEFGVSFCMMLLWCFEFTIVKYLPLLTTTLGFHGSMFLFAGVCISSAVFIIAFMPKTKGRSCQQIMKYLSCQCLFCIEIHFQQTKIDVLF